MEASGQLYAPATLNVDKEPLLRVVLRLVFSEDEKNLLHVTYCKRRIV
jgi:hypothetical protein